MFGPWQDARMARLLKEHYCYKFLQQNKKEITAHHLHLSTLVSIVSPEKQQQMQRDAPHSLGGNEDYRNWYVALYGWNVCGNGGHRKPFVV
jgi:hypothetical protein